MPMPHRELTFEEVVSDPKLAFDRDFRVGTAADRGEGERWDHRDHFLEAALERELDSAETPPRSRRPSRPGLACWASKGLPC
jgi:hypothetical protein